jgi:hypothetical protein
MSYGISHTDPLLLTSLHASLELEAFRETSMDQCQTFIRTINSEWTDKYTLLCALSLRTSLRTSHITPD